MFVKLDPTGSARLQLRKATILPYTHRLRLRTFDSDISHLAQILHSAFRFFPFFAYCGAESQSEREGTDIYNLLPLHLHLSP